MQENRAIRLSVLQASSEQTNTNSALGRMLAIVIIITILFPYLRILPLNTDLQPNFLLVMLLYIPFIQVVRISELMVLFIITVILLFYTLGNPATASFRAWPSYLTPLLVLIFTRAYLADDSNKKVVETVIRRSFYFWIGLGVLQFVSGSPIFQITYRSSTTLDRGWMSFANEPSAYGTVLFLFAAFFAARQNLRLVFVALVVAAVVCQSAVGLLYFVILAASYGVVYAIKKIRSFVSLGVIVIVVLTFFNTGYVLDLLPGGSRLSLLIASATTGGSLQDDASIVSRAADLTAAYTSLGTGSFFGNGLSGEFRLKSGWGAYVFELGWVGLIIAVCWISYFLWKAQTNGRNTLASTGAIIIMLFSSTPLAMPMVTFVIAVLIFSPTAPNASPHLAASHV